MARIDSDVSLLAVLVTAALFPIFATRTTRRKALLSAYALVGGTVVPVLVGLMLPAVQKVHEAASRAKEMNNMK